MLDPAWRTRAESAQDVVSRIRSNAKVFIHGAAATPVVLAEAMCKLDSVENVRLYHLHTEGNCAFAGPEHEGRFRSVSLFTGSHLRTAVKEGRADFMPIFLSDIPDLFRSGIVGLDVALVQLSPPDRHGMCTLGTSVDVARAAVDSAQLVLAEINEQMPRTHGHTGIPLSRVHAFTLTNRPLPQAATAKETAVEAAIGEHVAALVEDGATLQMGIGAIPNAVLARLGNKVDLGVHTEMFSDLLIPLMNNGVVTNRHKAVHPGRTTTAFVTGSTALFEFVNENSLIEFHGADRTNDVHMIRQNPRVVAINSALEIDVSGQVCADSLGFQIFSGIGGQMDFMQGAARSRGGKPIIALPATAAGGQLSRIVMSLKPGAGVVTTRGHVHWVVTEFGAVNLHGMTLRERAEALLSITHPDFRGELKSQLKQVRHFVF